MKNNRSWKQQLSNSRDGSSNSIIWKQVSELSSNCRLKLKKKQKQKPYVKQAKCRSFCSMRLNPALPNSHLWLAVVYRVEGKHEASASSLERGLQCEPHDLQETIEYWRDLCNLGWDEEADKVRAFIDGLLEKRGG